MTDSTNPYESPQSETQALLAATPAESKWRCHGVRLVAWVLFVLALGRVVYLSWNTPFFFDSHFSPHLLGAVALLIVALCGAWFNAPWCSFGVIYGLLVALNGPWTIGETVASIVGCGLGWAIMGAIVEAVCAWILRAADKPLDTQPPKADNNDLI